MQTLIGLVAIFIMLIFSISKGIFIGYPLIIGYVIFAVLTLKNGYGIKEVLLMSYEGGKKSFVVLQIFVLIGTITAVWMSSGTVPAIVYYGINLMNPNFFIVYAFLISSSVSFLLGTSVGTASTVGLALIVMAKGGGVDLNMASGAIIAGAFFGDRCSPMSSSANLVANLTGTELYTNIKNMLKSSILPFIISVILYIVLSLSQPLNFTDNSVEQHLVLSFKISSLVLLPSIIILGLSAFRVNVKISMFVSILSAISISFFYQDYNLNQIIKYIILGFYLDPSNPLYTIIKGGGMISMYKPSVVVFVSCSLAGILETTRVLEGVEVYLEKAKTRSRLFFNTTLVSLFTAAFGSSQAISVVLTSQLMSKAYTKLKIDKYQLALDIENTGIVLSALIPWNLAAYIPTTTMDVNPVGFIPYAFYIYLLPIVSYLIFKKSESKIH